MQKNKWLFAPLKQLDITQSFGENRACIDIATGTKTITCDGLKPPKGYKSVYSQMKGHNGVDFRAKRATPIYCPFDGYVEEYVAEDTRGLGLGIVSNKKYYCNETGKKEYMKARVWHNLINLVKKGERVKVGQVIALVDNTGYSSGDHLHLELKPVTISKGGVVKNILQDNGFFGAIDPMQYMLEYPASIFNGLTSEVDKVVAILKHTF